MKKILVCAALIAAAYILTSTETKQVNVSVVIPEGGTVWDVTSDAMRKTGDNRDIREVIYHTVKLNDIKDVGKIQAGTTLVIPCEVKR